MSCLKPTVLVLSLVLCVTGASAQRVKPLPPDAPLAGRSQLEWSQRWWQWAFSFDRARRPVSDGTGERCGSRQEGPVWFLAGAYGSQRVERTCTVPQGKTLFFPLINYIYFTRQGAPDCLNLLQGAIDLTNDPSALVLSIDGQRIEGLQRHRQTTKGCFSIEPGSTPDAAASGYYVALPPLSKGRHQLEFGGVLPSLIQAISYTLVVE